jgi:hypothetical protein
MKIKTWDDMPAGSVLYKDWKRWVKLTHSCHIVPSMSMSDVGGMSGSNPFDAKGWGALKYFPMQYLT